MKNFPEKTLKQKKLMLIALPPLLSFFLAGQFAGTSARAQANTYNVYQQSGIAGSNKPAQRYSGTNLSNRGSSRNSQDTMNYLEETLNAVDSPQNWSQTAVSNAGVPAGRQSYESRPSTYRGRPANRGLPPYQNQVATGGGGIFPGVSKQEMLRIFLEGGSPQTSPVPMSQAQSGRNSANTSNAYSNYQQAQNEANKARYQADRARYEKDKWNRKNAASQAEYAANNAEYAAQRAESAAYSGDSQARSYANLARQAANRARASANQARYNANTIQ